MMKANRDEIYAYSYCSYGIKCPNCRGEVELSSKEDNKAWCYYCEEEIEIGE